MRCQMCASEAIERCYTCGGLFCADHGKVNCARCATGIAPGDSRIDRISVTPLAESTQAAWWRPQSAEDYEPTACVECQGLARYVCVSCGSRYCRDHAGKKGLCCVCQRAQRHSNVFLALAFLVVIGLTALGLWQAQ